MTQTTASALVGKAMPVPPNGTKHSPNLARWVNKQHQRGHQLQVFIDHDRIHWIGWIDEQRWFIGNRLMRVLIDGARTEVGCWTFRISDLTPLPGFWTAYERIGRCAIDAAHRVGFIGSESRWLVDGDTRHCLWCGEHTQHLHRWTETTEHSAWRAALQSQDHPHAE